MENENNNVPNTTDQVSAMDAVSNTLEQPAEPSIGVIPADASAEATPVAPETPAAVEPVQAPVEGAPVEVAPVEGAPVEEPTLAEGVPGEAPVEVGVVSPDGTQAPVDAPKKSKLPLIIGIVVAVLAIGAAVYFLFLKKDEEKPVENNTTKPVENTTQPEEKSLEDLVADYLTFLGDGYLTAVADDVDGDKTKDETGIECKAITYEDLAAMKKAQEENETNATDANTTEANATEANETNETNETSKDAKTGPTGYFACKKAPDPVDSVAINKTKETDKALDFEKELQLTASCTSARKDEKCEDNLKWESLNTKVATVDEKTGKVKNVNSEVEEGQETVVKIRVKYAEKTAEIDLKMKGGKKKPVENTTTQPEQNTTTQPETNTTPTPAAQEYPKCSKSDTPDEMKESVRGPMQSDIEDWTLKYIADNCPTFEQLKTAVQNEAERYAAAIPCSPTVVAKARTEALERLISRKADAAGKFQRACVETGKVDYSFE